MLSGDQLGMWLCCRGGCVEATPWVGEHVLQENLWYVVLQCRSAR